MGLPDHLPLPAELAEPDGGVPADVQQLLAEAESVATDTDRDPTEVVVDLVRSEGAPAWHVTDDRSAEWALRKVAEAELEVAALQEAADEWLVRIGQWFRQRARTHQVTLAFFRGHLQRYALQVRADTDGRTKSVILPSGRVATTEQRPKAVVTDDALVAAWADRVLGPDVGAEVAPLPVPPPRKVYLNPLREHVQVVQVVDAARLVMANTGEVVHWLSDRATMESGHGWVVRPGRCPQPGDGWPSPEDAVDLVAQVQVLGSHLEVHGPDGQQVPGTDVDPGSLTATVKVDG